MVIALGLPPREIDAIADSDPVLFDVLRRTAAERWDTTHELLAGVIEMQHACYRQLVALGGAKRDDIPKPIRIPRPGDIGPKKPQVATGGEFAAWIRERRRS